MTGIFQHFPFFLCPRENQWRNDVLSVLATILRTVAQQWPCEDLGGWYPPYGSTIPVLGSNLCIPRRLFPTAIAHWVFNNSSAHGSLAKDALTATNMNVNPGGNVPKMSMRDTIIPLGNPHPTLMAGMKVILAEHDYTENHHGKTLSGECKACKALKSRKPHLEGASADEEHNMYVDYGKDTDEGDERPVDCCMRRLLSLQPDFAREKSQLKLLIEAEPGMVCHFMAKFHLKMNPIEYFWAWVKCWFYERSNGTWQKAKDLGSEGLRLCPLPTICWFYGRADRHTNVYRLGATGPIAEFAVKKYRSHRGVGTKDLSVAKAEWKAKAEAMVQWGSRRSRERGSRRRDRYIKFGNPRLKFCAF
ncbi:hypothetical protein DFH09DRAFT_952259 [Mycena vulgaris]|nr:hypothetical protein DFH09DRAFT_952259 [Mycena vulgaris]